MLDASEISLTITGNSILVLGTFQQVEKNYFLVQKNLKIRSAHLVRSYQMSTPNFKVLKLKQKRGSYRRVSFPRPRKILWAGYGRTAIPLHKTQDSFKIYQHQSKKTILTSAQVINDINLTLSVFFASINQPG